MLQQPPQLTLCLEISLKSFFASCLFFGSLHGSLSSVLLTHTELYITIIEKLSKPLIKTNAHVDSFHLNCQMNKSSTPRESDVEGIVVQSFPQPGHGIQAK